MSGRWQRTGNIWGAYLAVLLTAGLSGCASTGIVPIGKDTYMVSKQSATGFESAVGVKGQVLKEANEFCARQGLVMVLVSLNTKDGVPGRSYATAELVFRAVRQRMLKTRDQHWNAARTRQLRFAISSDAQPGAAGDAR